MTERHTSELHVTIGQEKVTFGVEAICRLLASSNHGVAKGLASRPRLILPVSPWWWRGMLAFNVSCGSHRKADYQHATLSLCPFTSRLSTAFDFRFPCPSVRSNLVVVGSGGVALVSSFSEYGLGKVFPLMPLLVGGGGATKQQ